MNTEMRNALLSCVKEEITDPGCTLTDRQWCGLLNSYIRKESPEECAAKTGLRPIQADGWYIRLSMKIIRNAVRRTYGS